MGKEEDCCCYKVDEWGLCHWQVDCMIDSCTNNCYRDRAMHTKLTRRQTSMDLSNISNPQSADWLTAPEYPSQYLETDSEFETRRAVYYAKLASKYPAGTAVVGEVKEVWESYATSTFHATITYPVQDGEFTGTRKVDCFIGLASPSEVVRMAQGIYEGRILVVNSDTKQILSAHSICF